MPEDRRLIPGMTAEENILLPAEAIRLKDANRRLKSVYELIPELVDLGHRPATTLSGGQQKLVALARALMIGDKLLLLDEPSEGVAPSLAKRIMQILSDIRRRDAAILVSDSNEKHLQGLADKTFYIERGAVS
jgi:branched-chain amino acid transport system ATP-binding protein